MSSLDRTVLSDRVRFGILGLVEVHVGQCERRLSALRQRELLASLLLSANHVVPSDVLIEQLWPAGRLPRADRTLHTHVMRLRKALGDAAGDRIVTRFPGYLVQVGPDELDADLFDTLSMRAAEAAWCADWYGAYADGCSALALWRGEPLLDVPDLSVRAHAVYVLAAQRLQTLQTRIQALIGLGGQAAAAAELRPLAKQHPLHEGFAALRMLALGLDGRRADALIAYQEIRKALVAELGVEPGAELRDLHQRILDGDSLTTWLAAASPAGASVLVRPARSAAPAAPITGWTDQPPRLFVLTNCAT